MEENILEKRTMLQEVHEDICPVSDVLAKFGDKWALFTMLTLGENGTMRFNEIKHSIDSISQRMLTVTLRGLEQNGMVSRTMYPQIPPRVEYQLTPLGNQLLNKILDLSDWVRSNMDDILIARKTFSKERPVKDQVL
jgi:DNA-binding HxlR family transcriptional regulator